MPSPVPSKVIREQDFRIGGKERLRGEWNNGMVSDFHCVYQDIVQDRRIVYSLHDDFKTPPAQTRHL